MVRYQRFFGQNARSNNLANVGSERRLCIKPYQRQCCKGKQLRHAHLLVSRRKYASTDSEDGPSNPAAILRQEGVHGPIKCLNWRKGLIPINTGALIMVIEIKSTLRIVQSQRLFY